MREFSYISHPAKVYFGAGSRKNAGNQALALGMKRPMLLSTKEQFDDAQAFSRASALSPVDHFGQAMMHTPIATTNDAVAAFAKASADGVVSFGGGSTIGLGKAMVHRLGVPHLAVPTTYAGSEMTPILGQTDDTGKTTFSDRRLIPDAVIYDVELTIRLPRQASVTSALNALAHAIEAMYSPGANPVLDLIANEAVKVMVESLPTLASLGKIDSKVREDAQYGAWLCAICLAQGGVALHHKLCHVLGGAFDLPHAETHAVVLPYALDYNAPAIPEVMDRLKTAFGTDPGTWLRDLLQSNDLPSSLGILGMPRNGIEEAARLALAKPYPNPRKLEENGLRETIEAAWRGKAAA